MLGDLLFELAPWTKVEPSIENFLERQDVVANFDLPDNLSHDNSVIPVEICRRQMISTD